MERFCSNVYNFISMDLPCFRESYFPSNSVKHYHVVSFFVIIFVDYLLLIIFYKKQRLHDKVLFTLLIISHSWSWKDRNLLLIHIAFFARYTRKITQQTRKNVQHDLLLLPYTDKNSATNWRFFSFFFSKILD